MKRSEQRFPVTKVIRKNAEQVEVVPGPGLPGSQTVVRLALDGQHLNIVRARGGRWEVAAPPSDADPMTPRVARVIATLLLAAADEADLLNAAVLTH